MIVCELMIVRLYMCLDIIFFFFQAEDGIRDLVRSRGLGDVYKRQFKFCLLFFLPLRFQRFNILFHVIRKNCPDGRISSCLLYTSDAADERSSVDLGGRRIIKKKTTDYIGGRTPL